ncbi:hypothetical protein RclHR1_15530008 [Rhizophagus clarus]|uniref:BTB domain-containing protein n=1 Tax=Rhizophagus clarus TaxID=94130 RepID=A0A2Z6QW22_9GLOM|nr:hypothetical protein RclHR1_15530008 [Rhizophagus clarus]GES87651.1 hypothetical protein GLOIN_2v1762916 [Rhizophagus clarus]
MALIFHSGLSKDLSSILNDADDYDIIIKVGENKNTREFRAHSVILRARSPYFKGALSSSWITKEDNMIIFNKPNVTPTVFEMILKYIYTGELDLTEKSGEDILGLLVVSDELLLEELFVQVQEHLIEKRLSWVHENFIHVLYTVFKLDNCNKLQDYCLEFICINPQSFIISKKVSSLDKDILFNLLKRNDLQIEEINVWDCLIKWGIEQTPGLGSENNDRTKWNDENFEELKNTLEEFIPLIRFVGISRADFFDKVRPYKAIIPKNIYEEVVEFHYKDVLPKTATLPPRTIKTEKIESKIINPTLVKVIINWIERKSNIFTRNENDQRYKFKLIYRGSRDGINNESFRKKCNGRISSIVLIKVKDTNKIFGGYSSIGFCSLGNDYLIKDGYRFYKSSDNFIFSFENNYDIQNMKISRVVNDLKAILDHGGCNFGRGSLCMIEDKLYLNNGSGSYEKNLNTDIIYNIEEIETFVIDNQ